MSSSAAYYSPQSLQAGSGRYNAYLALALARHDGGGNTCAVKMSANSVPASKSYEAAASPPVAVSTSLTSPTVISFNAVSSRPSSSKGHVLRSSSGTFPSGTPSVSRVASAATVKPPRPTSSGGIPATTNQNPTMTRRLPSVMNGSSSTSRPSSAAFGAGGSGTSVIKGNVSGILSNAVDTPSPTTAGGADKVLITTVPMSATATGTGPHTCRPISSGMYRSLAARSPTQLSASSVGSSVLAPLQLGSAVRGAIIVGASRSNSFAARTSSAGANLNNAKANTDSNLPLQYGEFGYHYSIYGEGCTSDGRQMMQETRTGGYGRADEEGALANDCCGPEESSSNFRIPFDPSYLPDNCYRETRLWPNAEDYALCEAHNRQHCTLLKYVNGVKKVDAATNTVGFSGEEIDPPYVLPKPKERLFVVKGASVPRYTPIQRPLTPYERPLFY